MVLRCALVLACLLALPSSALAVEETLTVPTPYGRVWVEISRPATDEKVPILLTYSPYNTLSDNPGGNVSDDSLYAKYGPLGYARAVADVIGTRNSTGCWDYGGKREQQSGVELVNALAKQPWSNGKVAMIGASYDGTTANMVAVRGTEVSHPDGTGLAAIVPQAAINHWYGYAFQDGVRYFGNSVEPTDEGVDTPLAFDFGLARTPPTKPDQESVLDLPAGRYNPCDSVEHTQRGYDTTPDYDQFWLDRDYRKDAANVRIPALVTHGWQDYNVKQSEGLDFYDGLVNSPLRMLYMWQGPHGVPGGPYNTLLTEFLGQTLKGEDNGLESGPKAYSFTRTGTTAAAKSDAYSQWPPAGTRELDVPLVPTGTGPESYTDTGTTSEEEVLREGASGERSWQYYLMDPLTKPLHLVGSPVLETTLTDSADHGQLSPTLLDVAPDGTASVISRGHLNLQYRDGLAKAVPVPAGAPIRVQVRLAPQDQTIPAGHRLALIYASSNVVWALPDEPAGYTITVDPGKSQLVLPVLG